MTIHAFMTVFVMCSSVTFNRRQLGKMKHEATYLSPLTSSNSLRLSCIWTISLIWWIPPFWGHFVPPLCHCSTALYWPGGLVVCGSHSSVLVWISTKTPGKSLEMIHQLWSILKDLDGKNTWRANLNLSITTFIPWWCLACLLSSVRKDFTHEREDL